MPSLTVFMSLLVWEMLFPCRTVVLVDLDHVMKKTNSACKKKDSGQCHRNVRNRAKQACIEFIHYLRLHQRGIYWCKRSRGQTVCLSLTCWNDILTLFVFHDLDTTAENWALIWRLNTCWVRKRQRIEKGICLIGLFYIIFIWGNLLLKATLTHCSFLPLVVPGVQLQFSQAAQQVSSSLIYSNVTARA